MDVLIGLETSLSGFHQYPSLRTRSSHLTRLGLATVSSFRSNEVLISILQTYALSCERLACGDTLNYGNRMKSLCFDTKIYSIFFSIKNSNLSTRIGTMFIIQLKVKTLSPTVFEFFSPTWSEWPQKSYSIA